MTTVRRQDPFGFATVACPHRGMECTLARWPITIPRVEIQLAMPRRHDTGEGPSILFARRCIWSRSRKWRRATADSREALELDMVFAPFTHGQIVQVLCHCGFLPITLTP